TPLPPSLHPLSLHDALPISFRPDKLPPVSIARFQRAIQFEETLRAGSPPESEQNAMRGRLALYKQSQPFRDKRIDPFYPAGASRSEEHTSELHHRTISYAVF